jgi:hypothetical protein
MHVSVNLLYNPLLCKRKQSFFEQVNAAVHQRFADDRCTLTRSPGSAPTGLTTQLSIFALAKQLRQPSGFD